MEKTVYNHTLTRLAAVVFFLCFFKDKCIFLHFCNNLMHISHFLRGGQATRSRKLQQNGLNLPIIMAQIPRIQMMPNINQIFCQGSLLQFFFLFKTLTFSLCLMPTWKGYFFFHNPWNARCYKSKKKYKRIFRCLNNNKLKTQGALWV